LSPPDAGGPIHPPTVTWRAAAYRTEFPKRCRDPETAEARALASELIDYEIRVDENANDRYGAFKVGKHDDLVTAIGLAVQPVRQPNVRLIGAGQRRDVWHRIL
jgi:hypothetical protein